MKNVIQTENAQSLDLSREVKDEELKKSETLNFHHTYHSLTRAKQRNIYSKNISIAIEYGQEFFKQGLVFYVLGENNLPKNISHSERKKYENIVVVVSGDSNTILTCYRSKNPFKHIKKKQKNLSVEYFSIS